MRISEPKERSQQLVDQLVCVWERSVRELTVNEQNQAAVAFYETRGFHTVERLETDGQGEPYPLLRMELQAQA